MKPEAQSNRGPESDEGVLAPFGFEDDGWIGLMRDASRPEDLGSVAGYRVLEEVSRGGQGVVFRAREESSGRVVALKRLAAGSLAGSEARARFRREIEAEAVLRHPHIVGYQGVEVVEGQPLLVMEWIEGQPAVRWARGVGGVGEVGADSRTRPVREVLETFAGICDAVSYAHQRGVIHRDLKPSNILIDGAGEPHVLDFGLARWRPGAGGLGPELSRLTRTEGFVGTPAYAAPELLTPNPDGADVRADVYAMGVVLYEMLTGRRPFEASEGDWERLRRSIREETPAAPSRHDRRGDGEVDAIVLRAMAKDPARRYQSAHERAADVRRYLAGEPVEARRDSAWYVFRKAMRRHRGAAVMIAAVGASLLVGLGVAAYGLVAARRSAAEAARHAEVAEAVNAFLNEDVLRAIVPAGEFTAARGRDVKLREVLEEAGRRLDAASAPGGRLAGKPLVEAGVRAALGDAYLHLGEPGAAEPHVLRDRDLLARVYGPDDPRSLESAPSVGWLLTDQGRYEESVATLRPVLDRLEAMPESETALAASVRQNLAIAYWRLGRHAEAAPLFERALEYYTRTRGPGDADALGSVNGLAEVYREQRRFAEAEPLYRRLVEASARTLGESHPATVAYTGNLASLLWDMRRYAEAEPLMRTVLEHARAVHGPDHASTARAMGNLANLLRAKGDEPGAEALRREAFEAYGRALGAEHPFTLNAATDLAASLMIQGRLDEADALLRPALDAQRRTLGPEHLETRKSLGHLSLLRKRQDRLEEAERLMVETVDLNRRLDGPEHPGTLGAQTDLAQLYGQMGRIEEAHELLARTLEVERRVLGIDHPFTRICMESLALALEELGRPEEARALKDELAAWGAAQNHHP